MTNTISQHYKGYESLISRLDDLSNQCDRYHKPVTSSFLNEAELTIAKRYIGNTHAVKYDGGYPNAMKCKVIFLPSEEDDFSDVVCLVARIDTRFVKITHRDVMGALMNLNIERNQFGDFWVDEEKIVLYTSDKLKDYVIDNFIQVHHLNVSFEVSLEHYAQEIKTKSFQKTVNSERLDSIVAAMANVSRVHAQQMIKAGNVQVNHETLEDSSKLCHNNCTISIRGAGRYIYRGIAKVTKKDRLLVEFEQYI